MHCLQRTPMHVPDSPSLPMPSLALGCAVILINKWILDPKLGGFPYPLALTTTHMLFCSIVAWVIIKAGFVEAPSIDTKMYLTCVHAVNCVSSWGSAMGLNLHQSCCPHRARRLRTILLLFTSI